MSGIYCTHRHPKLHPAHVIELYPRPERKPVSACQTWAHRTGEDGESSSIENQDESERRAHHRLLREKNGKTTKRVRIRVNRGEDEKVVSFCKNGERTNEGEDPALPRGRAYQSSPCVQRRRHIVKLGFHS